MVFRGLVCNEREVFPDMVVQPRRHGNGSGGGGCVIDNAGHGCYHVDGRHQTFQGRVDESCSEDIQVGDSQCEINPDSWRVGVLHKRGVCDGYVVLANPCGLGQVGLQELNDGGVIVELVNR